MLDSYGIKPVTTTVRNPKSNGVIKRVHLTMGDMLWTMTFSGTDWFRDMERALDAIAWVIHASINPAIKHSPCHLAFKYDMIFCHAATIDWNIIHNECQKLVAASNQKENQSRHNKEYSPGDQVLIILDADEHRSQPKMNTPTHGPYTINKGNTKWHYRNHSGPC
jgi:hypothetical protein